jgi:hypothetical protein
MQRTYILTYHQNGLSHTMELNQVELDNILAIGDQFPCSDEDGGVKYEITAHSSDNRIWWGNSPLPTDVADRLLKAGLAQIMIPGSPAVS